MVVKSLIKTCLVTSISLLLTLPSSADELDDLHYITESYPPYNFSQQGKIQGIAVELLLSAMSKISMPLSANDIKIYPWTRAYMMTEAGPNMVLFSMTRTAEREDKFHWVGPIVSTRIVLTAKKSENIVINAPTEIGAYTIGAITNDIGDQLVRKFVTKNSNVIHIPKAEPIVRMLNAGRVKLWAYDENVARWFISNAGFNYNQFETVYTLKESDLYYAFSKDISKKAVDKLQKAIDEVKASGEFAKIVAKYI